MTTEYRQAVKFEARNPCILDHNNIKSAVGTTEDFFCRAYGTLIYFKTFFTGIPHYVLHTCLLSAAPNGADFFCYEL